MLTPRHRTARFIAASAGLVMAAGAQAQTWSEVGDAADLPGAAQVAAGTGPLLSISGAFGQASDVDMYQIYISDFGAFSASTVGWSSVDTQLFLFDAAGLGVASNDDEVGGTSLQSTITSQFIPSNGLYYLAISVFNRDPASSGGLIFSPPLPRSEVNANGPGAASPVIQWNNTTSTTGAYTIVLSGASFVDPSTPGACCFSDGSCSASTLGACASAGGSFAGESSTCGTANCPPGGSCCLPSGQCIQRTSAACTAEGGFWGGAGSVCNSSCVAVSYLSMPLTYNWNGLVSEGSEQGPTNFNNPDGYRSVADRGLLLTGSGNSINAGPLTGLGGMPYDINTQSGTLDIVHLGDRRFVANAARNWGTSANNALQPAWLLENDQTTPQVSDVTAVNATLTAPSQIGIIYQISDFGGRFDCMLTFTDNTSVVLTLHAPDWFNSQTPPQPQPGSGLIAQRQLGVYMSTQDTDNANFTTNNLNVVEAVTSVQRMIADGLGDHTGKRIASITFLNPVSNANYANSTPANASGVAILAATMSYPGGGPVCYANCDGSTQNPVLNVADFSCFLTKFAAGDNYANCDGSTQNPVLNVADFSCFLTKFAAGCR